MLSVFPLGAPATSCIHDIPTLPFKHVMELPATLQADLSILLRLVVAVVLGGVIGWERETAGKAAGVRTHMLVAVGAALFVALANAVVEQFAVQQPQGVDIRADPVRIIEAVVTGISFLGAGTIFVTHGRERVEGLTTAASIWVTAAVGIAVGLERFVLAAGSTALIFLVLRVVLHLPFEGDQQERRRRREAASDAKGKEATVP